MNPNSSTDKPSTSDPDAIIRWLAEQGPADRDEAPPLPEDLLKQLEITFGKAADPIPAPTSVSRSWFSLRSFSFAVGLAAACVVALLMIRGDQSGGTSDGRPVLRGGNGTEVKVPGVAWHWDTALGFEKEREALGQEGFTEDKANAMVTISIDTQSDPQFVLVSGQKNGIVQPEWSVRLAKLPADAQRPERWLQALLDLQSKIDASF